MRCRKCGQNLSETQLVCHVCGSTQVIIDEPDGLEDAPSADRPVAADRGAQKETEEAFIEPSNHENTHEASTPKEASAAPLHVSPSVENIQHHHRSFQKRLLVAVFALAIVVLGAVSLIRRSEGPSSAFESPPLHTQAPHVADERFPNPAVESPNVPDTNQSGVQEAEDGTLLLVTSEVTYSPGESESDSEAEVSGEEKARERAVLLAADLLRAELAPEEQSLLKSHCTIWAEGKLRVTNRTIYKTGNELRVILLAELNLQEWREYLSDKRQYRPTENDRAEDFSIDFSFYRSSGEEITPNATLANGDRFVIAFNTTRTCYVYILNRGTSGGINVLYPPESHKTAQVPANAFVRLPSENDEYLVQGPPGQEQIVLIASEEPVPELELFIRDLRDDSSSEMANDLLMADLRTRDIAIVERVKSEPDMPDMAELKGTGTFMHEVQFRHR